MKSIFVFAVFVAMASAMVRRDAGSAVVTPSPIEALIASIKDMGKNLDATSLQNALAKAAKDTSGLLEGVQANINTQVEKATPEAKKTLQQITTSVGNAVEQLKTETNLTPEKFQKALADVRKQAEDFSSQVGPQFKKTFENVAEATNAGIKNLFNEVHNASPDKHLHTHAH